MRQFPLMRLKKRSIVPTMWLTIGYIGGPLAAHADPAVSLGVMPSYSEGDYGTSSTTKIEYVPVYLKYKADDLDLKLTIPYISVESTGALVSGGTVIGKPGAGGKHVHPQTTESGLGDIWLEARYRIMHGTGASPDVLPYAKVKFGTASQSQGLGTGETDYEGGVGFEWAFGTATFPFVDVGYRVLGEPPGVTLKDFITYDAGLMLKFGDRDFVTGMFAGHQHAISGEPDPADFIVSWSHTLGSGYRLQAYLDKGLTTGSPDYAVGAGVETRF